MTDLEFNLEFSRLEVVFNGGMALADPARLEYYEVFRHLSLEEFHSVVSLELKTFQPTYAEKFPSIAVLLDQLAQIRKSAQMDAASNRYDAPHEGAVDYCQRCHNQGFYLGDDDAAHPCVCHQGQVIWASWQVPVSDPDRRAKIDDLLAGLSPSKGPVRGLREKDKNGRWQDNAEEHDRKMSLLRMEIAMRRRLRATNDRLKADVKETMRRIEGGEEL
jgi:hypothetical protein